MPRRRRLRVRSSAWRLAVDAATPSPRAAAGAVLRRARRAGSPPPRPTAARRSSTSAAGTPSSGRPPHVVEALAEAAAASPTATATRPSAGCRALREAIAEALPRPSTASSSTPSARWRSSRARRRRSSSSRSRSPSAATRSCCPIPTTPTTPRGSRSPAPSSALVPLDPAAGWQPDLDDGAGRGRALPQLPVEPVRRLRRARASSRRRSTTRSAPARRSSTTPPTSTSSSTAAGPRASSQRPARRRSASSCGRCRRATAWRAGGSASSLGNAEIVERINLLGDHARVGMFAALQQRGDRRARGAAGRASRSGARPTSAAATGSPRRCPSRRVCEGTLLRLAAAARRAERRAACSSSTASRSRPGEGFGPSGAGWARLSLAVSDETLEAGIERLAPALAAADA